MGQVGDNKENNSLKPVSQKELKVDSDNRKLDRSRSLGKSVLMRKATMWRRKSRHTIQMKNEDRERKATETLAIVLGICAILLYKTNLFLYHILRSIENNDLSKIF